MAGWDGWAHKVSSEARQRQAEGDKTLQRSRQQAAARRTGWLGDGLGIAVWSPRVLGQLAVVTLVYSPGSP